MGKHAGPDPTRLLTFQKPIFDLTPEDLDRFPVWECALDGEDQEGEDAAAVRPMAPTAALDAATADLCVVRACFALAGGGSRAGYFSPSTRAGIADLQPVVVTGAGQVPFWLGSIRPGPEDLIRLYDLIEEAPGRVFPIRFRSAVPIGGSVAEGVIEGFYCLEPGRSLFTGPAAVRLVR